MTISCECGQFIDVNIPTIYGDFERKTIECPSCDIIYHVHIDVETEYPDSMFKDDE